MSRCRLRAYVVVSLFVFLCYRADGSELSPPTLQGTSASLLINGGFATGLPPWNFDPRYIQAAGAEAWSPLDANGSPGSGSAFLTVAQPNRARQLLQCVSLTSGQIYEFSAKAYFPPGQVGEGQAVIGYVEYASINCSGTFTGFGVLQYLPSTFKGVWQTMRAKPPLALNAGSMQVIIGPLLTSGSQFSAHFDDAIVREVPATVVVSSRPEAMVQLPGQPGASTRYTLTNVGEFPATIVLGQQGSFFSQGPASFVIAPRASQTITVNAFAQSQGTYEGASLPSGEGVPPGTTIPIRLAVVDSSGTPRPQPGENRIDVSAPSTTQSFNSSVEFSNPGTTTLRAVTASDVPWIITSAGLVTIAPGARVTVPFTLDRAARSTQETMAGSATGSISLRYLSDGPPSKGSGLLAGNNSGSAGSTVKDSAPSGLSLAAPAPLENGVALFIPGVGHIAGSVGTFISDLSIAASKTIGLSSVLDIYYTPSGSSSSFRLRRDLIPDQLLNLTDIVKSYFLREGELGTLQIRTALPDLLSINATVVNKSNLAGTYGSAIPVLRSDRAVFRGDTSFLTGLTSSASEHTNLVLQETSGSAARVDLAFLKADGTAVGSTRIVDLTPFGDLRLNDAVPPGAVSATLRNRDDSSGRFLAFATPVDAALERDGTRKGGDTWVVADWPQTLKYSRSQPVIIPVAGVAVGANNTIFRTDLAIFNTNEFTASGKLTFSAPGVAPVSRQISLEARQSGVYRNVLASLFGITTNLTGYLVFEPQQPAFSNWLLSGRIYATVGEQVATFGTGLPALALRSGIVKGETRRFSGFDDSGDESILARRAATFRSNLGLVETGGKPVRVRATLYNTVPEGATTLSAAINSKDYDLAAGQFLFISRIANDILGGRRSLFRSDLRDLYLDLSVISGDGAVVPFISSIDNGTADQVLQTP